ncbi:L-type lectin-domain containing receptor kinase IV.2 [Bienertia sinuspersici]
MSNGSLDKLIYGKDDKSILCWSSRFKIIKGVASALLYLHEEWEQVVLHRDIKASNVLLDADMNARLGDFGLARLYDHNNGPRTTHVVGTIGYIAPEVSRMQRPTTRSDVFAFGMFLLEVGCGRRPIGKQSDNNVAEELFLSDWVYDCWKRGDILMASDPKMEGDYREKEMELVLKLGILCLHPKAKERPTMRQVTWFLNGSENLPDIPSEYDYDTESGCFFREFLVESNSLPSSENVSLGIMSSTNSVLQYGRLIVLALAEASAQNETQFAYNGFQGSDNKLHIGGLAKILPNGVLEMSDYWPSDAYYPDTMVFEPRQLSFSTTFVFAMPPPLIPYQSSNGITFIITPTLDFQHIPSPNCLTSSNNVFAVVLGAIRKADKEDIDGNHVEIYVRCAKPADTAIAAYYSEGVNRTLLLNSGKSMQIWIVYDEVDMMLNLYVGFSSGNGIAANTHYIQGWSWNQSGQAHDLDPFKLPKIPLIKHQKIWLNLLIPVALLVVLLLLLIVMIMIMIIAAVWLIRRKKYKELLEPWEKVYTPNRFSYKDLSLATKNFHESKILGVGGFGKVYKGILPSTGDQIAVKRISHNSKQGMKEFVAEISSMRRLRHRNLVPLLGYCRRKGELLLVYEYMQNRSLEKFLYGKDDKSSLSWSSRFKIIKGVVSALLYLHEGCEQVILHRDVKASNVLLDVDMNARLSDFGLAKFCDHNNDPQTTHVVGINGYIAPEICKTRKPNTSTDVYAFGMFLLEVACGRRPTGKQDADTDDDAKALFLSDWVYECWKRGDILKASDPKMEGIYQENEMELILKLGLVCLHPKAEARPSMRQVDQFLDGSAVLPEMSYESDPKAGGFFVEMQPLPSSSLAVSSSTNSVLHYGRNHVVVKRVSHDSKEGMKEFVAEISSMRRLRHRNLVRLLGYCRRKGELLLVYEYMSNGSVDKLIYGKDDKSILCWSSRFKIIKGVASALLYLHEEWEQVVLHRDIKANFMITTMVPEPLMWLVGTIGYIAPEVSRMQRPTTRSDVFAFGMFLLEVGCGRRPIGKQSDNNVAEELFLSDWVYDCWKRGDILMASDPKMESDYQEKEMELVLKLGILCLHPKAKERPTMRQVTRFLSGSEYLIDVPPEYDYESEIGRVFREFLGESIIMSLIYVLTLVVLAVAKAIAQNETQFTYNGYQGSINKLHLGGLAKILPNGVLEMSDYWPSDAYYPDNIVFKPNRLSFSTTFVFAMPPPLIPYQSSNGIIFIITSSFDFKEIPSPNCLSSSNNVFAVVLGAIRKADKEDIDGNHVEIYESCDKPVDNAIAAYYSEGVNRTLLLNSGKSMQIWIDYDEVDMMVNVTLAPFRTPKPKRCLLSKQLNLSFFVTKKKLNLSSILVDSLYVGFSSGNGVAANTHYIQGWSWNQSGEARDLDPIKLPTIPLIKPQKKRLSLLILVVLLVVLLLSLIIMIMIMIIAAVWLVRRKKYKELVEPWEKVYTPNRFSYKDLSVATKDFHESKILGVGGFGKVYKGILPSTDDQIAVKRISHNSKQGMKEFVAEISSMRRLRHRNLVPLLGYCRRKGELLLVYEYMQNGSLEKFLYGKDDKSSLSWSSRFKIIKGVASALLYLHEGCKQVILHRDVKASNVLLDVDMNARLSDFGLAKFYDHNNDPQTTHVVGTIGYIAPEVCRTRKANTSTDVYAFGMFLLEVGCGRRPTGKQDADTNDDAKALFLSDWVYECWKRGEILKASDPKMEGIYQENEMELILKLGLVCLHPKAEARPSMRQVDQFLDGSALLPEMSYEYDPKAGGFFVEMQPLPSSSLAVLSSTNSVLQYGRNHVAEKRVSHDSKQGMKEFVADISSMRRLRHRKLVRLLGYCRRKGELVLVYEYMSNGSLDKLVYGKDDKSILHWSSRFKIIKGVASAFYTFMRSGNKLFCIAISRQVMLGDFGLARLYNHNNGPRTTHAVGTIGYIAPEISRMQRPTTRSDVFTFGMFLLEVGCGRRPIGKQSDNVAEELFLSDWVYDCWKRGDMHMASDPKMEGDYQEKEMELVLKLGILCLHPKAKERPTMRQVTQFLNGSENLPDIPSEYDYESESGCLFRGFLVESNSLPSSGNVSLGIMSSTNSVLQYGR